MPKLATHVILKFQSNDTDLLYRASSGPQAGLSLACRQGITVISGSDPNPAKKQHRSFIDELHAYAFLKRIADLDVNEIDDLDCRMPREQLDKYAEFDERSGETRIVHPGSKLELKN